MTNTDDFNSLESNNSVIFRNIKNEDLKCTYDKNSILSVGELKNELKHLLKPDNGETNDNSEEIIKMFFKGRPLQDTETLKDLSLSNNDVILYMKVTNPKSMNDDNNIQIPINDTDSETSRTLNEEGNQNPSNFVNRGFNRFVLYGVPARELQIIRILFHSAIYQQSVRRGVNLDWSRDGILEREERWLHAHANNQGDTAVTVRLVNRYEEINFEPTLSFLKGLILGIFLNVFGIFLLMLWNFNPKFRCGLKLGIIIGFVCFVIPYILFR